MTLTKEQYEILKKYDKSLFTAVYCKFVRTSGKSEIAEVVEIYKSVFNLDKGIVGACQHCLYEAYKKLGTVYFNYKKELEDKNKAVETIEPVEQPIDPKRTKKASTTKKTASKNKKK